MHRCKLGGGGAPIQESRRRSRIWEPWEHTKPISTVTSQKLRMRTYRTSGEDGGTPARQRKMSCKINDRRDELRRMLDRAASSPLKWQTDDRRNWRGSEVCGCCFQLLLLLRITGLTTVDRFYLKLILHLSPQTLEYI